MTSWRALLHDDPLPWLLERQDDRGRWAGGAPYADRMPSRSEASTWVTTQAVAVLKHAFPETTA